MELVQHATYVPIDILAHRQRRAGHVQLFVLRAGEAQWQFGAAKLFKESIRHLHRRVRRVERQVAEERLLAMLLDETNCFVGEVVGDDSQDGQV